jgi:CRISPR-associated protein Csb1
MIDTTALLADANTHRLVLQATLVPVTGGLFQPAGFPDIGHVIYDAPRFDKDGNPLKPEAVCVVDSAASMANHLEAAMHIDRKTQTLDLHDDLKGMPYIQCLTDGPDTAKDKKPTRLVLTSLSEAHRLASTYFLEGFVLNADGTFQSQKKTVKKKENGVEVEKENEVVSSRVFGEVLREAFGIENLGKKTHPLPGDWWNVFRTIFRYDPNSLVHGILFPAMGIKLSRVLTAHHEAFGAKRVGLSGVKFDKLEKTDSKQSIFPVDKETANEIRATFVIDISLIRSFGRGTNGINDNQKVFLLELALWKIGRLLAEPYAFRSGCDLKLASLVRIENDQSSPLETKVLQRDMTAAIRDAGFQDPHITKVYWPSDGLFKPARDEEDKGKKGKQDDDVDSGDGDSGDDSAE